MFKNSSLFNEASILKTPKNIPLQILIFIAVFIVIAIAESILSCIYVLPAMFNYLADNNVSVSDSNYMDTVLKFQSDTKVMIVSLFSTISATVITMVYCRFIEGRPLSSMGIRKKNLASHYFFGVLTGLVLMSAIVALEVAFGGIKISSFSFKLNYGFFFLYLFGFFFQGMSEEFIFRGYLMNSIGGCGKPVAAIIISSCAFSAAHLLNPGVSPLAVFNLFLFAAFASLWILASDDIWGTCGIHSMWNFAQGNIFGISVSGTGSGEALFSSSSVTSKNFLNGGSFGIEGGIVTTIILIAAIGGVLFYIKNKKPQLLCVAKTPAIS